MLVKACEVLNNYYHFAVLMSTHCITVWQAICVSTIQAASCYHINCTTISTLDLQQYNKENGRLPAAGEVRLSLPASGG